MPAAVRVSTQTVAEVLSTYRTMGPSTKGKVVMAQFYRPGPGAAMAGRIDQVSRVLQRAPPFP